eukprot:TRINITY_DN2851_c0_g1_i1.p1 TRINITY_DN2851_c0_g1~~TRINITY_DN2851_c0_g1_i1.p1  ORF type:complete len:333 (-),score=102.07 TRINITY_DN2851_c0_g1_i1:78-1076(-)
MCNFKFKFDLPPPLPGLKLFFYPLEPDRYYKPKVTHYDATKAPDILADTNMGVPFEEMIINPYRYETVKSAESEQAKHNLAFLDYVFGEYVKADERPQPPKLEEVEPQTKVVQPRPEPERPVQARPRQVERPEEMTAEKFTSLLKKRVRETFEKKITIKEGDAHPKKSGVTCKKVYGISPNFSLLSHEMTYIRLERQFEESPSDKLALRLEQHSENTSKYVGLFRNDATITPESYIGPKDDEEGHSMKDEDDGLRSDEGKSEAEGEAEVEPEARERNEESDEENYFESDDDEPAPAKAAAKEQDEQEAEEEDQPRQRKGRLRRGHDSENEED